MPPQQPKPQPPHRIFWIMGWLMLGFGTVLFGCGYYLVHEDIARILGLILITLGGIGFGGGGRMLVSCYLGLKKYQSENPQPPRGA